MGAGHRLGPLPAPGTCSPRWALRSCAATLTSSGTRRSSPSATRRTSWWWAPAPVTQHTPRCASGVLSGGGNTNTFFAVFCVFFDFGKICVCCSFLFFFPGDFPISACDFFDLEKIRILACFIPLDETLCIFFSFLDFWLQIFESCCSKNLIKIHQIIVILCPIFPGEGKFFSESSLADQ